MYIYWFSSKSGYRRQRRWRRWRDDDDDDNAGCHSTITRATYHQL